MNTLHVFDIDNTLFDTYMKNKMAYQAAGLPVEYTFWHHKHSNKTWPEVQDIIDKIREEKARVESRYMVFVEPLPYLKDYVLNNGVCLTGASKSAVALLEDVFDIELKCPFGYSNSSNQKFQILTELALDHIVHYYDDDEEFLKDLDNVDNIITHRSIT